MPSRIGALTRFLKRIAQPILWALGLCSVCGVGCATGEAWQLTPLEVHSAVTIDPFNCGRMTVCCDGGMAEAGFLIPTHRLPVSRFDSN